MVRDLCQAVEESLIKVGIIRSSLRGECICSLGYLGVVQSNKVSVWIVDHTDGRSRKDGNKKWEVVEKKGDGRIVTKERARQQEKRRQNLK